MSPNRMPSTDPAKHFLFAHKAPLGVAEPRIPKVPVTQVSGNQKDDSPHPVSFQYRKRLRKHTLVAVIEGEKKGPALRSITGKEHRPASLLEFCELTLKPLWRNEKCPSGAASYRASLEVVIHESYGRFSRVILVFSQAGIKERE